MRKALTIGVMLGLAFATWVALDALIDQESRYAGPANGVVWLLLLLGIVVVFLPSASESTLQEVRTGVLQVIGCTGAAVLAGLALLALIVVLSVFDLLEGETREGALVGDFSFTEAAAGLVLGFPGLIMTLGGAFEFATMLGEARSSKDRSKEVAEAITYLLIGLALGRPSRPRCTRAYG